jgi:hypothetical protein
VFWPKKLKKPCKVPRLYVKINVDSFNALCGGYSNLATSVEEAADHFAVGAAFITRFFFV